MTTTPTTFNVRLEGMRFQATRVIQRLNIEFTFTAEQGGTTVGRIPEEYRSQIIDLFDEADNGPRPYETGAVLDYWPRQAIAAEPQLSSAKLNTPAPAVETPGKGRPRKQQGRAHRSPSC